jgi:microcystin-dependent protein
MLRVWLIVVFSFSFVPSNSVVCKGPNTFLPVQDASVIFLLLSAQKIWQTAGKWLSEFSDSHFS